MRYECLNSISCRTNELFPTSRRRTRKRRTFGYGQTIESTGRTPRPGRPQRTGSPRGIRFVGRHPNAEVCARPQSFTTEWFGYANGKFRIMRYRTNAFLDVDLLSYRLFRRTLLCYGGSMSRLCTLGPSFECLRVRARCGRTRAKTYTSYYYCWFYSNTPLSPTHACTHIHTPPPPVRFSTFIRPDARFR